MGGVIGGVLYANSPSMEATDGQSDSATTNSAAAAPDPAVTGTVLEQLEIDDPSQLSPGQGLLEVVTYEPQAIVYVGEKQGRGEVIAFPLAAGTYPIIVEMGGQRLRREVQVTASKRTRWIVEAEWQR